MPRFPVALLGVFFFVHSVVIAAPTIGSPVNQASFLPPLFRQYGIAQGAMFAVFGEQMGPEQLVIVSTFPIPITLAGTSVQATVGAVTVDCFIVFTSARQLAAILPSNTPLGEGTITVTYHNETSPPARILVVDNAVGIFTVRQNGQGPGIITDVNFAVNSYINAFAPGSIAMAWVTGLGARTPDDTPAPQDLNDSLDVEMNIGGLPADIIYAGPSGCCSAVDQVIFEIPPGREGCHVPVAIRVDDSVSNFATMSISSQGTTCSDPHGLSAAEIQKMHDQGSFTVASVVLSKVFPSVGPTFGQPAGGGPAANFAERVRAQQGTDITFDNGVTLAEMGVFRLTPDNYFDSGVISQNSCIVQWFVSDPAFPQPESVNVTGNFSIESPTGEFPIATLSDQTDPPYVSLVPHTPGPEAIPDFTVTNEPSVVIGSKIVEEIESWSSIRIGGPLIRDDKRWFWSDLTPNDISDLQGTMDNLSFGGTERSAEAWRELAKFYPNITSSRDLETHLNKVFGSRPGSLAPSGSVRTTCWSDFFPESNSLLERQLSAWFPGPADIQSSSETLRFFPITSGQPGDRWGVDRVDIFPQTVLFRDYPQYPTLDVSSSAFADGEEIPTKYTCDGEGISPPIEWSNAPPGTQSFAIMMQDFNGKWHWVEYDIPATTTSIAEGSQAGVRGTNDFRTGHTCPTVSERYAYYVYAAKQRSLGLPAGASASEVISTLENHTIAIGSIRAGAKIEF